jgi:hypothetical protein
MTYFLRSGNTYRASDELSLDLHKVLPVGNYIIQKDMHGNLFFEMIDSFEVKGKIYGDTLRNTDRILNTFMQREVSTGVMLNGEKGSGKTLLAKNLSVEAAKMSVPTIVINVPWTGDKFNTLIQSIEQPCIILFDEFEKVYDKDEQEAILTLLDGVFPSKKLFILTCNDKWRVDSHMRNRPGRIFYMLDFTGLEASFIREYCEDNLINKQYIEKIISITSLFGQFNFDMLKALVEEMNRYDEDPATALKMLNAKPEYDSGANYTITIIHEGVDINESKIRDDVFKGNPLGREGIDCGYYVASRKKPKVRVANGDPVDDIFAALDDDDEQWFSVCVDPSDLVSLDAQKGQFVFKTEHGQMTLTRAKEKTFNYYGAF